jgi:hypothetical protein
MAPRDERPRCVYCGAPTRGGRTCYAHRDLERIDPAGKPARRPATEDELGVPKPAKPTDQSGREELY